jgi:hypothetical protein
MQNVNLSTNLLNGILQYLGTRPFTEVANLIAGIQGEIAPQLAQAAPAQTTPAPETTPETPAQPEAPAEAGNPITEA